MNDEAKERFEIFFVEDFRIFQRLKKAVSVEKNYLFV